MLSRLTKGQSWRRGLGACSLVQQAHCCLWIVVGMADRTKGWASYQLPGTTINEKYVVSCKTEHNLEIWDEYNSCSVSTCLDCARRGIECPFSCHSTRHLFCLSFCSCAFYHFLDYLQQLFKAELDELSAK